MKGAYHKGLWCLWVDQSLWIRLGRNSTGCRRSPAGSQSLAWLALANLFWLLRPSDITVSLKVTTYMTYLCYCEQNQSINSALSMASLTSFLPTIFRMLPWRDPLVVHWSAGQTRLTGKDPGFVFPPGAGLRFTVSSPSSQLFGWGQGAPALPNAAQISKVGLCSCEYYLFVFTACH